MGQVARYRCKSCGSEFQAQEGGGFTFELYRCEKCDLVKSVPVEGDERTPAQEPGTCGSCGGRLSRDLAPMCQKCRTRETECLNVVSFYD
ncbi:MAG: hypothetical protein HYU64_18600 [Armatimonadetes bacterium]|nr:hypothetical protein [Armatimonadota bacterium]